MNYDQLVEEFGFDMWPIGDRQKGRIGSPMPAWYFDGHLEEEVRNLDNQKAILASGGVSQENMNTIKSQIAREEMKIDMIIGSFPKPDSVHRDKLFGLWKELGEIIKQSMFTHEDMNSGRANPHLELQRAKDPVIPIPRHVARYVIFCNGKVFGGEKDTFRVNRDDATRAWKMAGRILHESTWVEDLRPDVRNVDAPTTYRTTFQGFTPEEPEKITIEEKAPKLLEPELSEGADLLEEKEPRSCEDCGVSIADKHHLTKRCDACKEARANSGRKNTNEDAGGGT